MKKKIVATLCAMLAVLVCGLVPLGAQGASQSTPMPPALSIRTRQVHFSVWDDVWHHADVRWRLDAVWNAYHDRDDATGRPLPTPRYEYGFARAKGWVVDNRVMFDTAERAYYPKVIVDGENWNWVLTVEAFGKPHQFIFNPERDDWFPQTEATVIAMDDVFTVKKNTTTTLNVLANDFYEAIPDGNIVVDNHDPTRIVTRRFGQALPARGTAVGNHDSITYTPPEDYVGVDTFDYFLGGWTWARIKVTVVP